MHNNIKTTHSEAWAATILADIFEIKEELGTFKGALRSELAEIMQDLKTERDELRCEREAFKKFQAEAIAQIKQTTASSGVEVSKANLAAANNIVKQLESIKESGLKQFKASIEWEARTFAQKEILWRTSLYAAVLGMIFGIFSWILIPKTTTDLTMQRMLAVYNQKDTGASTSKRKHH